MIQPRTLDEMIAASAFDAVHTAIVGELGRLLQGVTVVRHPGKLDINDVVAKAVVQAPGVAVGWSRARSERLIDGMFDQSIEWVAYIVAADRADLATRKATPRETVAHAIGSSILEILADQGLSRWGIAGLDEPAREPVPTLTPLFTARSFAEGVVYYAVTWTQTLTRRGHSLFGGDALESSIADGEATVQFPNDPIPAEVRALLARHSEGGA